MSNGGQKRHPLTDILTINGYGLDMSANGSGDLVVKVNVQKLGLFIQSITRGMLEYCSDDNEALSKVDQALESCSVGTSVDGHSSTLVITFYGVSFDVVEDEAEASAETDD